MTTDDLDELTLATAQLRGHLQRLDRNGVSRLPLPAPTPKAPPAPVVAADPSLLLALKVIRDDLGDCTRCKLHPTRKNIVFGVGNPGADLVFVGEAPGANEDAQGEPFVGDAGQLLNKMINAMGWGREDVYIANILKCRPPGNRNPEPDEIEQCEPFLIRQLGAIKPRMIVALGKFAAQCLLRRYDTPISALRGSFHEYQGVKVMPTYHPAYLLRTPSAKRMVWDDLQLVMAELDRLGVKPPRS
jgi:uracil-DNA glycosylase